MVQENKGDPENSVEKVLVVFVLVVFKQKDGKTNLFLFEGKEMTTSMINAKFKSEMKNFGKDIRTNKQDYTDALI